MERNELAAALRQWRERLAPGEVGLPAGTRRRTPGLRREEVASLAGVSVDYLTRLEQGRGPHPSDAVLAALARALRLTAAEHEHLVRLGGRTPLEPGAITNAVRPGVQRLMDRLVDLPVMVVNARGDIVAWNTMAAALVGDLSAIPAGQRNFAWLRFTGDAHPNGARLVTDAEETARLDRATVADLRAATARHPTDRRLADLVARLRARSPVFTRLWDQRPVEPRRSNRKVYDHPQIGRIELDSEALTVPGDEQTLVIYSAPPGSPAAEALTLLRVIGIQNLTPT